MAASVAGTARDQGFSFGGSWKPSRPVVLSLPEALPEVPSPVPSTGASPLTVRLQLPGADLQPLKELCSKATCGLDGRDVVDESHRRALKLEPASFSCSFSLDDTDILAEIGRHAKPPPGAHVTATLQALNVYARGDYFKEHKDSPVHGNHSFGTLVVGLPSQFKGGRLRVWNELGQLGVNHDWSGAGQAGGDIQWAFIALGSWHEVQEVVEGHRLTLVYSLHSSNAQEISSAYFRRRMRMDVAYYPGRVRMGRTIQSFEVPFVQADASAEGDTRA